MQKCFLGLIIELDVRQYGQPVLLKKPLQNIRIDLPIPESPTEYLIRIIRGVASLLKYRLKIIKNLDNIFQIIFIR